MEPNARFLRPLFALIPAGCAASCAQCLIWILHLNLSDGDVRAYAFPECCAVALGPQIAKAQVGTLEFRRTVERIRDCGLLKQAKLAEIDTALAAN